MQPLPQGSVDFTQPPSTLSSPPAANPHLQAVPAFTAYPTGMPAPATRGSAGSVVAVLVVGVVALCFVGLILLVKLGLDITAADIEKGLRDNPVLRKHVGEIQSFEMDYVRSMSIKDQETFVYKVVGDRSKGTMTVASVTDDEGEEVILWAKLRLPDGKNVTVIRSAKD